ncbi:hypothetical protein JCM11251_002675 [Rhodosporidiobolus azoricus]
MLLPRSRPSSCPLATHALARRHFSSSSISTLPSSSSPVPPLIGSGGAYPRHVLIHSPHPASTWPAHIGSTSKLFAEIGKRWAKHPDLSKVGYNFTDAGEGEVKEGEQWDITRNKFEQPPEGGPEEIYTATVYPDFLTIPSLSVSTLPALESHLSSLPPAPASSLSPSSPSLASSAPSPSRTHIFICTHGTRDCRCGDLGEPLYQALLSEIKRRKLGGELKGHVRHENSGVRIARIGHIGGHKFAGNALVYTEGKSCDWYGLLRASDAATLLDNVLSPSSAPWWSRWRGRLGMTSEEVKEAYLEHLEGEGGKQKAGRKEEKRSVLGDPVDLVFVTYQGEEIKVKGYEGESLMETARRHDLPSILATCGGHCECATCHVYLPPALPQTAVSSATASLRQPVPIPQPAPAPEMTDEEDEQLEFAIGADDDSRLACQIPVTKELGEWCEQGGKIKLPRY